MTAFDTKIPRCYQQEDIQQILNLAIARQGDGEEFSREHLVEIAAELGISPDTLLEAEQEWLLPDTTNGNRHLLLTPRLTIERVTALAEVIEGCGRRIVVGPRPVKTVCLQPVVLSVNRPVATEHGIET